MSVVRCSTTGRSADKKINCISIHLLVFSIFSNGIIWEELEHSANVKRADEVQDGTACVPVSTVSSFWTV